MTSRAQSGGDTLRATVVDSASREGGSPSGAPELATGSPTFEADGAVLTSRWVTADAWRMSRMRQSLCSVLASAALSLGCGCERKIPEPDSTAANSKPDPNAEKGAALFGQYCALCHGKDARGYAADHAPSLVTETFLATASDEFLSQSIREGRPGTAMAAYGKERGGPLSSEGVAAIVSFLRSKATERARTRPPPPPSTGVAARGLPIYEATCRGCHGTPSQRGEAVHLANPAFLSAASDAFLYQAIVLGRPGTPMQAFASKLDGEAIGDLVALMRSWASPPPPAPARAVAEPPLEAPLVIHPAGKQARFSLRDDRFVSIDQVKQALEDKRRLVIIDARAGSDWIVSHIPGALPIPYYQLARLDGLPKDDTWVVAYCACPHHASGVIVDELRRRGFPHTAVLDEGILEWQKRGYPIVSASPRDAGIAPPMPTAARR